MKIVVDGAHGAAYQIAPKVFHELGADVIAIGCSPDGLNINKGVGATHPEALVEAVKKHQADYGITLDGDADRLQLVDQSGRLYNGDELLYLMVMDRLARDEVVAGVVGTLMTNMAVEVALKLKKIPFIRSKVGDRYVLEALQENAWLLGGEGSGHLLALVSDVVLFPQVLINVRLVKDQNWKDSPQLAQALKDVEAELAETGRVLIRPSGTEPLVRVMVEARDLTVAQRCAERIANTLR